MIEIKKLPSDRWRDYQSLRLEALKSEPTAFGSSYEEEVTLAKEIWQRRIDNVLFALVDDKPVGIVVYIFNGRLKTRHVSDIYGMYVAREYRNQGTGSKLISAAINLIKENKNILKIKLSVNPAQKPAVRLYEKFGFVSIGTARKEYNDNGNFFDELLMEKYL